MTTIFIPRQFHRRPTRGVPFVVPRHSTRPNCIQMTVIFIWWSIHRRSRGRGLSRRSSSFHETKLHQNDGHFHLVVNPSPIQGKGLHVHLVHKSMILQSGPFLVLEPQKHTCLPASFGHEKSQFLRRLKLTNQNINKFAGSFCQHNCYILGLFRLTKPKNPKIPKFWSIIKVCRWFCSLAISTVLLDNQSNC